MRDLLHHRSKAVPFCAEKVVGSETNWEWEEVEDLYFKCFYFLAKMSHIYLTAWIQGPFFHIEPSCQSYCHGFAPSSGQQLYMCGPPPQSSYIGLEVCECVSEQCVCPVMGWWPVVTDWLIPWIHPHYLYISISNSQKTESGIWRHFLKYLFWFLKLQFDIFVLRSVVSAGLLFLPPVCFNHPAASHVIKCRRHRTQEAELNQHLNTIPAEHSHHNTINQSADVWHQNGGVS